MTRAVAALIDGGLAGLRADASLVLIEFLERNHLVFLDDLNKECPDHEHD